jgi:exodeoxyribonuclease VII large subunit
MENSDTGKDLNSSTLDKLGKEAPAVLTIEQLNRKIKNLLELNVGVVWVRGEISNFKPHVSGHHYFSLKDASSQISAVMFKGSNSKLKFRPTDGMEVIAKGKITVYEPRGNYQIVLDYMEPVGAGALQKAFEQLKEKLKAEGLFDLSRKRPLPKFAKKIAVVTSPTGAAIMDILNIIKRRNSSTEVIVAPTQVQGAAATQQIVDTLDLVYKIKDIDVIIVGRGGGSIEDLWCFNEESVARKISQSPVPIVSAVGHEIDFTIADFVADLRAPTPSAAAELVTANAAEVRHQLTNLVRLLQLSMTKQLSQCRESIKRLHSQLIDPRKKVQDLILRNDDLLERLQNAIFNILKMRKLALQNKMGMLDSLSPLAVLDRGYSIAKFKNKVITESKQVKANDEIQISLANGSIVATVRESINS